MGVTELTRNAVHVQPEGALERKLTLARPLRVKFGIDVTAPDVHVGRAIPLQRMRAFQDKGHTGVLIIGDYTTRIGDPSGRSTERPILSDDEIDENAKKYFEQAAQIIDPERTEVRFNGEWLGTLDFAAVLRLTRTITVARLLERDDFANRFASQAPISVSELLYPLMQAYDSVAIEADVELGDDVAVHAHGAVGDQTPSLARRQPECRRQQRRHVYRVAGGERRLRHLLGSLALAHHAREVGLGLPGRFLPVRARDYEAGQRKLRL